MFTRFFLVTALIMLCSAEVESQTILHTCTTLSGYYDYQSNGPVNQYIRLCPASNNIHVVYMVATDSTYGGLNASRRTEYAFSTNGGVSWNNFYYITVPARRSGFPSLDLMRGRYSCLPVIANHSIVGGYQQSALFVDSPEGAGAFSELNSPPFINNGSDEPLWPEVACTSDGAIIVAGTTQASCRTVIWRNDSLASWRVVKEIANACGGTVAQASLTDSGKVGVALGRPQTGIGMYFYESTDNGLTWPNLPSYILPLSFTAGADSFQMYNSYDFTYQNNYPGISFTAFNGRMTGIDRAGIGFWSPSTGFVLAVPHGAIPGVADSLNKTQRNHLTAGYPAIAVSGLDIVIVFQAFMRDTSSRGFNYSDIFYSYSTNSGATWSAPANVTNTRFLDERYPSVSKWNAAGQINFVYQEDASPGSAAIGDGSDTIRTRQVFCRVAGLAVGVGGGGEAPVAYRLEQNYPNPFNPGTNIKFQIPTAKSQNMVTLKVFDLLGREVATLVNEPKAPGEYSVPFDASGLASAVYFYRLQAGNFVATRKLVLIR